MIKKIFGLLICCGLLSPSFAQSAKTHWVDSVFNTLNMNEKIGQLFMMPVSSNDDVTQINAIENEIKDFEIGGIILTRGTPVRQARLVNRFQQASSIPLLIGQDAAWGLATSLDSTMNFPQELILGAIRNDTLIYQVGSLMADQLKMVGVNLNFAPSPDIYNPEESAGINYWSFGERKTNVADKSVALMRGLQDHGVLACAKHFPIEGITLIDIQKGQPILQPTVDSIQVYPYTKLFANGLTGVMPAASEFPLFYQNVSLAKKNTFNAATLTSLFAGDWLRKNMQYEGLMFVDIQKVQILTDKYRAGEAELFAFRTGNDVLMSPKDIGPAIRKIKKFVRQEDEYKAQLDNSVKKILAAKFDAGLWQKQELDTDNLIFRLNTPEARLLNQKLYEAAITVIRNEQNILPLTTLEDKRFAYVTSEAESHQPFYDHLSRYVPAAHLIFDDKTDLLKLSDTLQGYDVIIVGIYPQTPQRAIERLTKVLQPLDSSRATIMCDFGNESFLKMAGNFSTVVTAYADTPETLRTVPQTLFGGLKADGVLPFTPSASVKAGTGIKTKAIDRLTYSIPEDAQMDSRVLQKIDSIATEAIKIKATPGCQVFVARNGKVVYEKSFGHLTYDEKNPVTDETIYDLASVTKVSATLQTALFMHERGLIDLYKKVSYYLPELKKTNKKDITLIDMLTHQSGLVPFVPLWPQTVKDTTFLPLYYSHKKSEHYPLQVAPDLYASPNIRDSVWVWITRSKMNDKPARTPYAYKYSDLGFLILQHLAEKLLNQPMDDFLHQNLYEPLGAYTTGFNPLNRFSQHTIAPTEDDKIFRKSFISGTVHDERAAMMGGVAGHAGLFSSANDLGKLCQMLLQNGRYGGYQYYKPETVKLFTARKFETSRRGIGWDKPLRSDWNSPASLLASPQTFGHTGFTGTCIWIDPEFDLVYIFLSNRVYPDRNNKLSNANIRSRIQDVIYQSIFKYDTYERPQYHKKNSITALQQ